ncbi:MAG TPA: hypothetical protein VEP49_10340 [Acidimicrobiia bacterium]|nr:hypothetical protein [Acidimicrobiia bacterium]
MRRVAVLLVALAASLVPVATARAATSPGPYRGLGSWVDVFDYTARTQPVGVTPPVTPASVDDMAALGVRTLYIQVVNPPGVRPDTLFDAKLLREFLSRGHAAGLGVVAWYLPSFVDVRADYAMVKAIASLQANGKGFDAVALDIEDTDSVPDVVVRNDRVVELAKRTKELLGSARPLAAIVYPAVQTEVINPFLWPDFPYRRLSPSIDVWMPMAYFTFRDVASGYRDPLRYTEESVARLRARLGDKHAPVHVIGGIADVATPEDYVAFLRAARETKAVGYSMYDFRTTSSAAWSYLRQGEASGAS